MLKNLRKELSKLVNTEQQMNDTQFAELANKLSSTETSLAALQEQFSQLTNELATAKAALDAANEAKASLEKDIEDKRNQARMDKIVAAVGTDKADKLFAATQALQDAQFEEIVGAMSGNLKSEADTPMFQEVGATVEVDVANVEEKSALQKALEEKYSASK